MANINKEYGPDTRLDHKFGRGGHLHLEITYYTDEQVRQASLVQGWWNGCPRARELTGPNSPYSPEWMLQRYTDTNAWYERATHQARGNRAVYEYLTRPKIRLAGEPVGVHEPESVPESHKWRISPMSGVEGYAASRLAIEIRNLSQNAFEGAETAHASLWFVAKRAGIEPGNYLAILANEAFQLGVQPEQVLHHVYPKGILEEENCRVTFWALARSLDQYAPEVWKNYLELSQSQREQLSLAEVPFLK